LYRAKIKKDRQKLSISICRKTRYTDKLSIFSIRNFSEKQSDLFRITALPSQEKKLIQPVYRTISGFFSVCIYICPPWWSARGKEKGAQEEKEAACI